MTNDSASPERRRRPRASTTKKPAVLAGSTPETSTDAPVAPAAVDVTPTIPRSIFSSPLTAAAPSRPPVDRTESSDALSADSAPGVSTDDVTAAADAPVAARSGRARGRGAKAAERVPATTADSTADERPAPETEAAVEPAQSRDVVAETPRRRRGRAAPSAADGEEQRAETVAEIVSGSAPATPEPGVAQVATQPITSEEPATDAGQSALTEWGVAPASDADLIAIARATGDRTAASAPSSTTPTERVDAFPDDEEMVAWEPPPARSEEPGSEAEEAGDGAEEAGTVRRRRRRGRGRRGGAGRSVLPSPTEEVEASASEQPSAVAVTRPPIRQPILPDYPVEFEPTPPPTKRRPARRPGMTSDPRFSREEQAEIDQFVRTEPVAPAVRAAPASDTLRASLLTAEEEEELARVAPLKGRPRRGRGTAKPAEPDAIATSLAPTPAFEPMPASAGARAGQSPMEALLTRQNFILDTLMERQIALLRNIERSLIAMDQRLSLAPQGFTNLPRAGVFVDVPNVIYAAERIGCNVDFGKLLALLTRGRELVRASAYAPVSDDPQMRLESQKFVQPFVGRGYRIVTKPLKRFSDGTMKGNFDVELAMDILTMADRLDVVCLVSGDGDFSRLVEIIASKGVRVEVVAFSASTSSELRATCDEYIDLGTRLREICS